MRAYIETFCLTSRFLSMYRGADRRRILNCVIFTLVFAEVGFILDTDRICLYQVFNRKFFTHIQMIRYYHDYLRFEMISAIEYFFPPF